MFERVEMTYPDKEHTIVVLMEWKAHFKALEKLMDSIGLCIGYDVDGPLFTTVWPLFESYRNTLAAEVGDFGGWLEWYQYENQMGANGMQAGYDDKLKNIKSLNDLYWLIEESQKRLAMD